MQIITAVTENAQWRIICAIRTDQIHRILPKKIVYSQITHYTQPQLPRMRCAGCGHAVRAGCGCKLSVRKLNLNLKTLSTWYGHGHCDKGHYSMVGDQWFDDQIIGRLQAVCNSVYDLKYLNWHTVCDQLITVWSWNRLSTNILYRHTTVLLKVNGV